MIKPQFYRFFTFDYRVWGERMGPGDEGHVLTVGNNRRLMFTVESGDFWLRYLHKGDVLIRAVNNDSTLSIRVVAEEVLTRDPERVEIANEFLSALDAPVRLLRYGPSAGEFVPLAASTYTPGCHAYRYTPGT